MRRSQRPQSLVSQKRSAGQLPLLPPHIAHGLQQPLGNLSTHRSCSSMQRTHTAPEVIHQRPQHPNTAFVATSVHAQGSEAVRNWLSTRAEGPARLPLPSPQNDCVLCSSVAEHDLQTSSEKS